MGESKEYMIKILRDRGWRFLKIKHGTPLFKKYGASCPIEACPENQLRAIYLSGKVYSSPRKKEKTQGQLVFDF